MATSISSRSDKTKKTKAQLKISREADTPSESEIRVLAYHFYEKRVADGTTGDAASDWTKAERLLTDRPAEGTELD